MTPAAPRSHFVRDATWLRSKGKNPVNEVLRLALVDLLAIGKHANLADLAFPMSILAVIPRALKHNLGQTNLRILLAPVPLRDIFPRWSGGQQIVRIPPCRLLAMAKVTAFCGGQLVHL